MLWAPTCALCATGAALLRAKLSRLPLHEFLRCTEPLSLGLQVAVLTVFLYALIHSAVIASGELGAVVVVLAVAAMYGAIPILIIGLLAGWAFGRIAK